MIGSSLQSKAAIGNFEAKPIEGEGGIIRPHHKVSCNQPKRERGERATHPLVVSPSAGPTLVGTLDEIRAQDTPVEPRLLRQSSVVEGAKYYRLR